RPPGQGRHPRLAWRRSPLVPGYGQFGSSREPILNSAGGTPSVWFTLSIFLSTLLYRLPCESFTTSVTKVVAIACRLASSLTSPTGLLRTILLSASRYFFCPSERSPFTASRPSSVAFMLR